MLAFIGKVGIGLVALLLLLLIGPVCFSVGQKAVERAPVSDQETSAAKEGTTDQKAEKLSDQDGQEAPAKEATPEKLPVKEDDARAKVEESPQENEKKKDPAKSATATKSSEDTTKDRDQEPATKPEDSPTADGEEEPATVPESPRLPDPGVFVRQPVFVDDQVSKEKAEQLEKENKFLRELLNNPRVGQQPPLALPAYGADLTDVKCDVGQLVDDVDELQQDVRELAKNDEKFVLMLQNALPSRDACLAALKEYFNCNQENRPVTRLEMEEFVQGIKGHVTTEAIAGRRHTSAEARYSREYQQTLTGWLYKGLRGSRLPGARVSRSYQGGGELILSPAMSRWEEYHARLRCMEY